MSTLDDGARLHVRPIRPEDAALERAFVASLSEKTRYFRFFYQLNELTPAMLARFTQVDYDREMALVAIDEAGSCAGHRRRRALQHEPGRGVGRIRDRHRRRLAAPWRGAGADGPALGVREGARLATARRIGAARQPQHARVRQRFGFTTHDDPDDPDLVDVVLELAPQRQRNAPRRRLN